MLYIVPTPIGNLQDITLRALELFKTTSLIISENTHTTKRLLSHYEINYNDKKFVKFTSHDHHHLNNIISLIKNQETLLVSEAGTPCLCDPGKIFINACQKVDIPITVLPGATALIPAIIQSNFPTTQRKFWGFLPHKKGREKILKTIISCQEVSFFYESVHRIPKLLLQLEKLEFTGSISVSRELSKKFEQNITACLAQIKKHIEDKTIPLKGEFVIGLYPQKKHEEREDNNSNSSY